MADTLFTPQVTPIVSTWAQDINNTVYRLLGDSSGAGGTGGAPLTRAAILANLGALSTTDAAATYETIANAAATYETIANAAATYETITGVHALQFAFKNRIFNGSMAVDQVNAGASQAIPAGTLTYTVDMWAVLAVGAAVTGQRVAGVLSPYRYQITGAAGSTSIDNLTRIESANINDLAGQTVTISADLGNSLLTSVAWSVDYANTADNFSAVTNVASGTIAVTATDTRYSFPVTLPAGAVNGLQIKFTARNQTSGTFTIGRVQLEEGAVSTSFDRRDIGTEWELVKRYYQRSAYIFTYSTYASAASEVNYLPVTLPTGMRTAPTVTVTLSGGSNYSGGGAIEAGIVGFTITATAIAVGNVAANFTWAASARL